MKKTYSIILFLFITAVSSAQVNFDTYFTSHSLRFDYVRAGNSESNDIFFEQVKLEPFWSGNSNNLLDKFEYGHYKYLIYDSASNILIFSKGYNTLFDEWQSTAEAKLLKRSFYETVQFPCPKKTVKLELQERNSKGMFNKKYEIYINPDDPYVNKESVPQYQVNKIVDSGDPMYSLDLVFIPEGYTQNEMDKFRKDAERFAGYFLECTPYKENKDKINIWTVEVPSLESGVTNPGINQWKNTPMNFSYYTQGTERYLMSMNIKAIRDIAACVPYDNICVISNSAKYGGGAIYNYYTSFPADDQYGPYLIVHEFGHHFCALGDEYYTSQVSVEDYYKFDVEPYEANLTTLVNFDKKWKNMIESGIPIPTPATDEYKDKLGAFEGGGYVAKGVYRPTQDCTMKSKTYNNFCPVCKKAIIDMINYYAGK